MTEIVQPDWLKGFQPNTEPPAGNPNWKKGMPSPNKNGRPRSIVDKRTRVTQALMDDAPKVARVVIDAALAGDVQAAGLGLSCRGLRLPSVRRPSAWSLISMLLHL